MLPNLIIAVVLALPGVIPSLYALYTALRGLQLRGQRHRVRMAASGAWWERSWLSACAGIVTCPSSLLLENVWAMAYFDTGPGHECAYIGTSTYCAVGGTAIHGIGWALVALFSSDIVLLIGVGVALWRTRTPL